MARGARPGLPFRFPAPRTRSGTQGEVRVLTSGQAEPSPEAQLISPDDAILVTGASGFIGRRVVENLVGRGFRNIRCLVRPSGDPSALNAIVSPRGDQPVRVLTGNLLSREDCRAATADVAVILHLAAGRGEKSFADAFMNSVVTTRNVIEAALEGGALRRFVNVSSLSVYTNTNRRVGRLLDESSQVEERPESRGDAYSFAKVKQDQLVVTYGRTHGLPYVIARPGYVYGPGNEAIPGRVGIGTFGLFLHLGGFNTLPLSFVDNCADAIVRAGLTPGVEGEVFNIVDDDLPSSRRFLRLYKGRVRRFRSLYVPHAVSYALCGLWEKYAAWSEGQLPPVFNRRVWHAYWRSTDYSNGKLKARLGWRQLVPTEQGLETYFRSCRGKYLGA